ncbi:MAG: hypothetical protein HKN00_00175 [Flavobacteriaceae bacterium]|nr:NRDE family protein [Bacteroidia bacterium]MBT8288667.1 NRDE family protein [Bacteroidia bacterium]NNF73570.1 hypothetical protein [Flavobacteriaceae bacterium]NNK73031.1 hypothetical protein [Flavobacteriaceae bacterium]
MCTVTYVPLPNDDFILTSNRDESPLRKTLAPDFHEDSGVKLLYPMDKHAGGTWIGISDKNRLICVLNGGFEKHKRKESYRKSRGLIAKDLLKCKSLLNAIEDLDCEGIEPFTMILIDWGTERKAFELIWDEKEKVFRELPEKSSIWSSSSLYDSQMKSIRKKWFDNYKLMQDLTAESIWHFHTSAGNDNEDYGVIMNRGYVQTTSITQVSKTDARIEMTHTDLLTNKTEHKFMLTPKLSHG